MKRRDTMKRVIRRNLVEHINSDLVKMKGERREVTQRTNSGKEARKKMNIKYLEAKIKTLCRVKIKNNIITVTLLEGKEQDKNNTNVA